MASAPSSMPESLQIETQGPKLKVMVSNLPAELTQEEFTSNVEKYIGPEDVDWIFYRQGKASKKKSRFAGSKFPSQQVDARKAAFKRSYSVIHFTCVEALVAFNRFCNNREIQAGNENTNARVTFAFFQKTPLDFGDSTDPLEGSIDDDNDYRKFVASETGQPYEQADNQDEDGNVICEDSTSVTASEAVEPAPALKPSRNRNRNKEKRKEKAKEREREEPASQRKTKTKETTKRKSKNESKGGIEGRKILTPKKILTATDGDISDLLPVAKPKDTTSSGGDQEQGESKVTATGSQSSGVNNNNNDEEIPSKQPRAPRQRRRKPQNKVESTGGARRERAPTATTTTAGNNDKSKPKVAEGSQSKVIKATKNDSEPKVRHRHRRPQGDSDGRRNGDKRSGNRQKKEGTIQQQQQDGSATRQSNVQQQQQQQQSNASNSTT